MNDPVRPLRVALAHPYSWPEVRRGGERYLADLAWFLTAAGHRVDVVTGTDGPNRSERTDGYRIHRLHYRGTRRLGRFGWSRTELFGLSAWPALLRRRYDVVHALTPTAALAARAAGQRVVYTVLGHPTPDQFRSRPLERQLFTAAVRWSHQATALSESAADAVAAMTASRPLVLPPGVRLDAFTPDPRPRTGTLRVLFVSDADEPRKGAAVLLRAFGQVLATQPDARLVHAGPGSIDRVLATLGADGDRVAAAIDRVGVGALESLGERYREATVTVLPARNEAFGLVVVESLACGTPVVAADTGGPAEIVDGAPVGYLVAPADPRALAAGILAAARLAADPGTPSRCVEHARQWDWSRLGPAHVDLYRRLARRRPRAH